MQSTNVYFYHWIVKQNRQWHEACNMQKHSFFLFLSQLQSQHVTLPCLELFSVFPRSLKFPDDFWAAPASPALKRCLQHICDTRLCPHGTRMAIRLMTALLLCWSLLHRWLWRPSCKLWARGVWRPHNFSRCRSRGFLSSLLLMKQ